MLAKEKISNKHNFKYADGLLYMMSALLGAAVTFKTETVTGWSLVHYLWVYYFFV
jgi:hypothetical protein